MKKYEIVSIEPTDLGKYWVISYKTKDCEIEKGVVEALDSHEAFIKFRNQMIQASKASKGRPTFRPE